MIKINIIDYVVSKSQKNCILHFHVFMYHDFMLIFFTIIGLIILVFLELGGLD